MNKEQKMSQDNNRNSADETLYHRHHGKALMGSNNADRLVGSDWANRIFGRKGDDFIDGKGGNDWLNGGRGNDTILGGSGDDTAYFNVSRDGADKTDLGIGDDTLLVKASGQVRLTFTSAEVGNGNANDANTMLNQDGGLAVRLQAEDSSGNLTGPVSRIDDEGITFEGKGRTTFDVRDLVSGAQRGDMFDVVQLGTQAADVIVANDKTENYYINAGMGDDKVTGNAGNDFLVGGAGADELSGLAGNDSFIGGGGNDRIFGGAGNDRVIFNILTDGADQIDLGGGADEIMVNATTPTQVRLTFTSAEVGNGNVNDGNTLTNQDGGLAVRMQGEDAAGNLTGNISRTEDESISFSAGAGVTFDVRDLVSGVARGDQFREVVLGSSAADSLSVDSIDLSYYFNAGAGNDTITGGNANDFLVGGGGDDTQSGMNGNDSFIGGGGNDMLTGGAGADTFIFAAALSATTNVETITDFSHDDDTMRIDDAFFAGLPLGVLSASAFALASAAVEADDRIIYDVASGNLYFDANGNSRDDAILFAKLSIQPANVDHTDFIVI